MTPVILYLLAGVLAWGLLKLVIPPSTLAQPVFWGVTLSLLVVTNLTGGGNQPWVTGGLWPFVGGAMVLEVVWEKVRLRWRQRMSRTPDESNDVAKTHEDD